jgi:hypothetical protein
MSKQSTSCACMAFYGCDPSLQVTDWFDETQRYFKFLEMSPSRCVVEVAGKRSRVLKWKTARSKIGATTDIQSISCYVETPEAPDLMQWVAVATWARPLHSPRPTVFYGYREDVGKFSVETCSLLASWIAEKHSIGYGIGYERNALKGPEAYALGMAVRLGHTAADEIERKRIALWWREFLIPRNDEPSRFRHLSGMVRDVYPVSILSSAHLSTRVGSMLLKDWIQSSPQHGVLQPISSGNWLWALDRMHMDGVREKLRANGLIIADDECPKRSTVLA